ncbi:MAG: PIN domain-containing protein [Gammaproteobacteria bacterium]
MRAALDTNVLAYAEGVGDEARVAAAITLIERLPVERVLVPAQALGELYRVLTGKAARSRPAARAALFGWTDSLEVADSTWTAFEAALDLCVDHQLQVWDALIVAVAAENRCRLLLSEDLQDGFTVRGVTVVNPFSTRRHPLLEGLLAAR